MNILMLWHDIPSPFTGTSLPAFNLLKHLSLRHNITLLAFKDVAEKDRYKYSLNQYCEVLEPIPLVVPRTLQGIFTRTVVNTISIKNLLSENFSFFNFYYLPKMQDKVKAILGTKYFDLIYTSPYMAHFVQNVNVPKVVHLYDCLTETQRRKYLGTRNLAAKWFWWLQYLRIKKYEETIARKFNYSIVVSEGERQHLTTLFKNMAVCVIPNGVDSEFFQMDAESEEWPSLIFVGQMNSPANVRAMLFFRETIWDTIKEYVPGIRLYIVGRDPTREINSMANDPSITVTGYVEDVRPFVARASIVVAPFPFAAGMKSKILEAMAMGKPVVSTSAGVDGINVSANENVIIANKPSDFADQVIRLLSDTILRRDIGNLGRDLVMREYSWQHAALQLEEIFFKVVDKQAQ